MLPIKSLEKEGYYESDIQVYADDLIGHDQAYSSTDIYVVQGKEGVVAQGYLYAMFFCSFVFTQVKGKTTGSSVLRRIDPGMFASLHIGSYLSYALALIGTFVLMMIAMIENSRMPIDDPKTHLELTMVHEVMILDNSGFDLGLILSAGYIKFAVYGALVVNLFIGIFPLQYSIPMFFIIQAVLAIGVGLIESFMARFRMGHNAQFIFALTSVSLLIFFGALLILGKFA